jgi:hypothetical protein
MRMSMSEYLKQHEGEMLYARESWSLNETKKLCDFLLQIGVVTDSQSPRLCVSIQATLEVAWAEGRAYGYGEIERHAKHNRDAAIAKATAGGGA